MLSLTYRCPRARTDVPVPFSVDPTSDPEVYEHVACPACRRSHLLNKSNGRPLGGSLAFEWTKATEIDRIR